MAPALSLVCDTSVHHGCSPAGLGFAQQEQQRNHGGEHDRQEKRNVSL